MMTKLDSQQAALFNAVGKILWQDWDPIGLKADGPEDEYQRNAPGILRLLLQIASGDEIAARLPSGTISPAR